MESMYLANCIDWYWFPNEGSEYIKEKVLSLDTKTWNRYQRQN
jgi:hypothetical protein